MYKSRKFHRFSRQDGPQQSFRRNNRQRRPSSHGSFDPTQVVLQSKRQKFVDKNDKPQETNLNFHDFALNDLLLQAIDRRGYKTPTAIQTQIIPHILETRDVVGIANTGTGKTAAFLLPILHQILHDQKHRVLIVAPTRELSVQIIDELRKFTVGMNITASLLIGGKSIDRQIESLRRTNHFVIGTPGRIIDLCNRGKLPFKNFTKIVLDEVDRMLDMGFVHDIKRIISQLPENRQSLFFSATMTDQIRETMRGFLSNPVTISTVQQNEPKNIIQEIVRLDGKAKIDMLHELLQNSSLEKVLVFGRTKHGAEKIKVQLMNRGIRVDAIHGNKSQNQRMRALNNFRNNSVRVLIATDVIARGLDITDVSHVVNYDLPESYETYIHRIGRTGRADQTGYAITFVE